MRPSTTSRTLRSRGRNHRRSRRGRRGGLPLAVDTPREGEAYFDVGSEGVRLGLVEAPTDVEYDLDHVALLSADPAATAEAYGSLGFEPGAPGPSGAPRVEVGGAYVEFHPGV